MIQSVMLRFFFVRRLLSNNFFSMEFCSRRPFQKVPENTD